MKGDGQIHVCRDAPSQLSFALSVPPDTCVCHNGKFLDVGSTIGALGLLCGSTIWLYPRLRGGGPLDVSGQWQCATCGALRCWSTRNQCYKCGEPRSAGGSVPQGSPCLDHPRNAVGSVPQGCSSSPYMDAPVSSQFWFLPPKPLRVLVVGLSVSVILLSFLLPPQHPCSL